MKNSFTWKIGGAAGYGIKVTGELFARTCTQIGLQVFDEVEYPSLIRGGHNTYVVRVEDREVHTAELAYNLLVALNAETVDLHWDELTDGAGILYDNEQLKLTERRARGKSISWYPIPLERLAKEAGGDARMRNTVAVGATLALVGIELTPLKAVLQHLFGRKGEDVVNVNVAAATAGYDYAKVQFKAAAFPWKLAPVAKASARMLLTGSEAMGLGAIAGGLQMYVAYPMTPSSPLLHFFAAKQHDFDLLVRQPEDEISVINTALGASFAGARAAIGTSGGGFALMQESFALAGITETPIVVFLIQRPGPATGLPTWTEQGDLLFLLHAGHGEFPRVIVAPGDLEECFTESARALNLADQLQTPVVVVGDKFLNESHKSTLPFDQSALDPIDRGELLPQSKVRGTGPFARYTVTKSGVSPRTLPGTKGGIFVANSDEHDPYGYSDETSANRIAQDDKRLRKAKLAEKLVPQPNVEGPATADVTLVCWGSTKGPVREAMRLLAQQGIKANMLHLLYLSPFPSTAVERVFAKAKKTVLVENNATGQLGQLIRMRTGLSTDEQILKYNGRQFYPNELTERIAALVRPKRSRKVRKGKK